MLWRFGLRLPQQTGPLPARVRAPPPDAREITSERIRSVAGAGCKGAAPLMVMPQKNLTDADIDN